MTPRPSAEIAVLVVSNNERVQAALSRLLERHARVRFRGGVASSREARDLVAAYPVDVVVANSPPGNLEEVLTWREVRDLGPRLLMLTNYMRDADAVRATLAGASGLILTAAGQRAALLAAIQQVSTGISLIPAGTTTLLSALATGEASSSLLPDERALLALLLEGRTDREIEGRLGIAHGKLPERLLRLATKLA